MAGHNKSEPSHLWNKINLTWLNRLGQMIFSSEIINGLSERVPGSILPTLTLRNVWFGNMIQFIASNPATISPLLSKEISPVLLLNDVFCRKWWSFISRGKERYKDKIAWFVLQNLQWATVMETSNSANKTFYTLVVSI